MPSVSATSPQSVKKAELTYRAFELRREGYNYREIGRELKVAPATALRYVRAELEAQADEAVDNIEATRRMELNRYDDDLKRLQHVYKMALEDSDLQAAVASVRTGQTVAARRAALLGLDAPKRVNISTGEAEFKILQKAAAEGDEVAMATLKEVAKLSAAGEVVDMSRELEKWRAAKLQISS